MSPAKSQYDETKDIELGRKQAYESEHTFLIVSVHRYNNGQAKIQIDREKKNRQYGNEKPKLGRLTYEEFAAVARTVKEFANEQLFQ